MGLGITLLVTCGKDMEKGLKKSGIGGGEILGVKLIPRIIPVINHALSPVFLLQKTLFLPFISSVYLIYPRKMVGFITTTFISLITSFKFNMRGRHESYG